jgi:hypothetical protein
VKYVYLEMDNSKYFTVQMPVPPISTKHSEIALNLNKGNKNDSFMNGRRSVALTPRVTQESEMDNSRDLGKSGQPMKFFNFNGESNYRTNNDPIKVKDGDSSFFKM